MILSMRKGLLVEKSYCLGCLSMGRRNFMEKQCMMSGLSMGRAGIRRHARLDRASRHSMGTEVYYCRSLILSATSTSMKSPFFMEKLRFGCCLSMEEGCFVEKQEIAGRAGNDGKVEAAMTEGSGPAMTECAAMTERAAMTVRRRVTMT